LIHVGPGMHGVAPHLGGKRGEALDRRGKVKAQSYQKSIWARGEVLAMHNNAQAPGKKRSQKKP